MKMIYKALLSIIIIALFYSNGFSQATLSIGTVSGTPGNSISVPIQATGINDMTGFQFTISYDKTKLTYINCSNWVTGLNAAQVQINPLDGKLTFVYTDAAINIANGKFFDLNFTVLNGSSGNAAISWSDSPTQRELSNSIPNEISCIYSNGAVVISVASLFAPVVTAATNIAQTSFSANWNSSATATGYRLDVALDNGFTNYLTGYQNKDVGNVTTLQISGLSINTTCYYRVRAYNAEATSEVSNIISVTTLQGSAPASPLATAATNIAQTSFSANWNPSATATGYRLDVALDNTFTSYLTGYQNKEVGNVVTIPVTGLTANTTYYYRIKAYNSEGTSGVSNTINVTTPSNQNGATLTIGNGTGTSGNTVSIPVSATKFSDVVGFQFTIVYDKTKLTFVNCTNWVAGLNATNVQINQLEGKLTFVYTDVAINIANGKFFDLNFTILNGTSGNASISWSDSPTQRELSNSIPNEISCAYSNGSVVISNSTLLANVTDMSCFGDTHPVAKVTATGEEGRTFYVQWAAVIGNVDGPLTAKIPFTGSLIVQDQLSYNSDNSNVGYYHFYVSDNMGSTAPIIGFAFGKVQNPLQATLVQDGLNAEITITGGILPYSYQVGSGAIINLPIDGNTFQVVGLQTPSTVVTVYDAHGCFVSKSLAVAPLAVTAVPESGNNMDKTFDVVLNFNRDVIVPVNGIIVTGGTALVTGSGKVYTVAITAEDLAEVKVILANTIADADGNLLNATTFIYNVGDHVAPTLVVTPPNIPIATVFNVGLAFSEPVSGVLGAVTVLGGTLTNFSAAAGGKVYTLSISSTEQTLVTIVISKAIKDLSLNMNPFTGQTLTYTCGDFASPELVTWTPANGTTTTDNHPNFKMSFNESVMLGTGGSLKICKVATTIPVLTIPITADMISGNDVTVNYTTTSGLDKNIRYYVLVDGTSFRDMAGNSFEGISDVAAWTFKTGANFATPSQQEIGAPEFKVYPNPTTGIITIEGLPENQKTKIAVFSSNGKLIMKKITNDSQEKIDISKQVPGTYLLVINKQTVKIVKE